ncbi:FtsX-like permease family protein [Diplocloster hominis]|uniref:FtsX-like permease family protein n=1 Tax=Diplocloster hominis TaxID=3079010 RepID=UPI0031BB8BC7
MTIQEIVRKMTRKNLRQNLVFCFAVAVSIILSGANGILLFSPTVTQVLIADGSTYLIAVSMYAVSALGISVFLIYVNTVYLKNKMGETGILLALGLSTRNVCDMAEREFALLYGGSSVAGILLSVPAAWICWSICTLFLHTAETSFRIGWKGVVFAAVFAAAAGPILWLVNKRKLMRAEIIRIMHTKEEQEVKGSTKIWPGILGLFLIPAGLILFGWSSKEDGFLGQLPFLFILVSILGIFLIAFQVTSVGNVVRHFSQRAYFRQLLFYNLIRQKGKQYTLALFVSSVLIAVTIFGIGFNSSAFIEMDYFIEKSPYEFAVLTDEREKEQVTGEAIHGLLEEHGLEPRRFVDGEFLIMAREHRYPDPSMNEWGSELITSQSTFLALTGIQTEIPEDGCIPFQENIGFADRESAFRTFTGDTLLYHPDLSEDLVLRTMDGIIGENNINKSVAVSDLVILHDRTYQKLSRQITGRYKLQGYFFDVNAQGSEQEQAFYQDLRQLTVEASGGMIWDNILESAVAVKQHTLGIGPPPEDIYIPYEGNELYAARWDTLYPFSRADASANKLETGAIYILLVSFASLVTFLAATLIISIKLSNTVWQDQQSYQKAVRLGLSQKDLASLITRQIALVYFFPTICGCTAAILLVHQIVGATAVSQVKSVTWVAVLLSLAVCFLQMVLFLLLRKRAVRRSIGLVS